MSGIEALVGVVGLVLCSIYTVMTLVAYGHVEKGKMHNRAIIYVPFWPFYPDVHDDAGKGLCPAGRWIFIIAAVDAVLLVLVS